MQHLLEGIRVVEIADETSEYCGLTLAGMGAEVIKVEPRDGARTRQIGPFIDDQAGPDSSLFFLHYNRGKNSIALDLDDERDRADFIELVVRADVLLESTPRGYFEQRGIDITEIRRSARQLVHARLTPFGDEGPWSSFLGSDLVHLALGGQTMNCGYDPRPDGVYDLPPIAPQMWQAYHVAGEQLLMGILAALRARSVIGEGQYVSCAIHEALAKNTEGDWPNWVMSRTPFFRQTCRHAGPRVSDIPTIGATKDGRWVITRGPVRTADWANLPAFMASEGFNISDYSWLPSVSDEGQGGRVIPGARPGPSNDDEVEVRATELFHRVLKKYVFSEVPWQKAQAAGFMWAPLLKPNEMLDDPHWWDRGTLERIVHEPSGREGTYCVAKWRSSETVWRTGDAAPTLDRHRGRLAEILSEPPREREGQPGQANSAENGRVWPLQGVRILDFTWFLASGGATRFLAAMGAETLKVEWKGNPDTRFGAQAPLGGREARERATAPLPTHMDRDMGGQFNNKHTGKYGISLNLKHPRGLEIAKELASRSDIVAEGFSPGAMERLGLGYDALRELRSDIIYAQQSAAGAYGRYPRLRTLGPLAQALGGLSEMSGLPEPAMPAGWGYSYLDWMGAYSFANAMLGALIFRDRTGLGQHIDASQVEVGLFINGTALLDYSMNNRPWQRYGNRSPYLPAAPHGIYPCDGADAWIAVASFEDAHWNALVKVLDVDGSLERDEFATLDARLANQDALDAAIGAMTRRWDRYELMEALQSAGVPAGVCQTAEDRYDRDPQLRHLEWLVDVDGTKIGRWPVGTVPARLDRTPLDVAGLPGRGAPNYGEDNRLVYEDWLGMSPKEVAELERDGVI